VSGADVAETAYTCTAAAVVTAVVVVVVVVVAAVRASQPNRFISDLPCFVVARTAAASSRVPKFL
jgi:hypothetical protein